MEEQNILELLWNRAESAIDALSSRFGKRLLATAVSILGSTQDAEEVVNDTYLAVWNTIPPQQPACFDGFVYRTGRNLALKKLRFLSAQKRSCQYDLSLDELAECVPGSSMDDALDARMLGQAINAFLATLSDENRRIFLRRYWFGDGVKQIAADFRLTEGNVSVRLNRIRSKLKAFLIKEGIFL